MAETPGLRKRKKTGSSKPQNQFALKTAPSAEPSKFIYTLGLIIVAFTLYLYPRPVHQLFDLWIGSSEWDNPPGIHPGSIANFSADADRKQAIVSAFKHAWLAYERDAMGADEYHPLARVGSNLTSAGGIGYTVIDSLDTMILMGLSDEYSRARSWIENKLSFERDGYINTFETTIRVLGGLLSAFELSNGDSIYLEKAVDLADRMIPAFDTPFELPLPYVNLARGSGAQDKENPGVVSTAEIATLQLELRYLSQLTGDETYWKKAENVMKVIKDARLPHGLASIFMGLDDGQFVTSPIRLGSRGDSFYEYLLKQYLQTGSTENTYREMYEDAMKSVHDYLIQKSVTSRLTYTSELNPETDEQGEISWRLTPKQDHLVCFLGGSLMLGATTVGALKHPVSIPPAEGELSETGKRDWLTGIELIKTCVATHDTLTGLSPEMVHFRIPSDGMSGKAGAPLDWYIKGAKKGEDASYDARYVLRPETIESLFIAWRLTGDARYREQGWAIFQAIERHCRIPSGGYASVLNVDQVPVKHEDKMESFLLSETFKYLYLLFADRDVLPLDKYVLNTEAHPLPIFTPSRRSSFGVS